MNVTLWNFIVLSVSMHPKKKDASSGKTSILLFLVMPQSEENGYAAFVGHKYGEQSYILIIPTSELKPGEYGIIYQDVASATAVPIGTFQIAK